MQRVGIVGGMFDPVHNGHLRIAIECKEALALDELRMFPCAIPPHRATPGVSPEQRLKMLQISLAKVDGIQADGRELQRSGPSYTVDTLKSLKTDFPLASLFLIIGSDAFQSLNSWHQWEKILELCNIVIAQRPSHPGDESSEVGRLLKDRFVSDLNSFASYKAGAIFALKVSQLEISSSLIRQLFYEKKSAQFLLPEAVLDYIKENKLYS